MCLLGGLTGGSVAFEEVGAFDGVGEFRNSNFLRDTKFPPLCNLDVGSGFGPSVVLPQIHSLFHLLFF